MKRLRVMLKAVKPVVLVPAAVKAAARVLAVVLEAAAAVGQVREAAAGQVREAGSGVPVTPPYLVSSTDPRYPPAARNREIEGTVYVKMLVSSGGSVENAFVARSSGNEALDGAAVEAVYNWNFSPAKDTYGSPVRCYITMPVNFVLH